VWRRGFAPLWGAAPPPHKHSLPQPERLWAFNEWAFDESTAYRTTFRVRGLSASKGKAGWYY